MFFAGRIVQMYLQAFEAIGYEILNLYAFNFLCRYEGSVQPESLKILLEYTLARGNLTSIFKVLKLLYGK